ncbi:CHASE2 domain-containing protein [Microvirga lotononidis]|uniref:Putative transmembrane sensor domain protein n=1 Tax=Microvirga lotononidis TaxID=864069 RepID=I4YWM0_9HYPH|nr:adenylate/guanylate cyclase domain-containing protein [Microvirga lotononidis]EIM28362.1 putative transmembrane sensor domain protein [Microvirga lotononidis]WQO27553.1 adenylate/guanylate cyclase domain-containing protein [Microvirga lotononidis]
MTFVLNSVRRLGAGRIVGLVLLAGLIAVRIWDPGPIESLRQRSFDIYQLMHPRAAHQELVTIVDIDEMSLRALGQWPWPRTVMADMLSRIVEQGGTVIGFDVLFPEPDRSSPDVAAETFQGLDDATREKLRRLPSNDVVFANAIRTAKVVLGQSGYRVSGAAPTAQPATQAGIAILGADPQPFLVDFPHLLRNLPILDAAAQGQGIFSIIPEQDGIIRRVPVVAVADGIVVPSLSLEMLRVATGAGAVLIKTDASGVRSVGVGDFTIPTDGKGRVWIHFASVKPERYVSAIDLLERKLPADSFAGKMVLIGTSAAGLLDLKVTPVHPAVPGVELHAQLLESALMGETLSRPTYTALVEIVLAMLLSLALIKLAPRVNAVTLFALGGATATVTLALSWYCFSSLSLLIDSTFPLISSLLVYAVLVCTNYVTVSADRYRIRSAFSQYLSPDLVEQLAQSPEKLTLGGEQRVLTVLFSDIRGFTAISELYKDDPKGLTTLINRLFTPLTRDIMERRGTIDKYMGDAIMAFWNAPLADSSHEVNACEAACAMLDSLKALNEERQREADDDQPVPPLRIGIGVNTGLCAVGNFGSDLHFNYSVLGDTVNLASRLESMTKQYGVPIIIGERTAQAVLSRFAALEIDHLQVRGKSEAQRIFAVLGRADVATSHDFALLNERNDVMLTAYRRGEWARALEMIFLCRELGKKFGLDDYYDLYLQRVRHLIETSASSS